MCTRTCVIVNVLNYAEVQKGQDDRGWQALLVLTHGRSKGSRIQSSMHNTVLNAPLLLIELSQYLQMRATPYS